MKRHVTKYPATVVQVKKPKKLTREEMIEAIVNQVDDWDLATLIEVAKRNLREELKRATDEEMESEYLF
jgi:hypothetical protein